MRGKFRFAIPVAALLLQLVPIQPALATAAPTAAACQLSNGIKHVIYLQFDNTHLSRDRANVPSDLQQMPNLLSFLSNNGTVSSNEHTILISHTAGGILSSLTGLYPDRNGITVSNSYRYFTPTGSSSSSSAFKYWTDLVDDTSGTNDPLPNMVTTGQKTTPAPWVPFTRAGCDYGAVSTANIVLENTRTTPFGDMTKVFGAGSPEWNEAKASNAAPSGTAAGTIAQTDFVGIAIHCAQTGGVCAGNANARTDSLPDEPGGYAGFKGLFGAKYVNPAITGGQPAVKSTDGAAITDSFGQPGFPGFDGASAANSLGYVAQMQEAGVPITFGYISDAHDNHTLGRASGPGEADYKAQLQSYDKAFGDFFSRLNHDGINKSNTLFVFTADENDHFAGGNSANGTWSHTFCDVSAGQACPANQIGEVTQNLNAILPAGYTPPAYSIHFDSAPTAYVTGNPARTDPALRQFERNLAAGKAVDPYLGPNPSPVMLYMADPVEEQALHMVNADPRRTPNFTYFANPDYFFLTFNSNCPDAAHSAATCVDYHFAWSHGDATPEIGTTWLGIAGPGVKHLGQTGRTWSDHTDLQPTILALTGLKDSYEPDGVVLTDFLKSSALPRGMRHNREALTELSQVYKQVTAPFGEYAHNTLLASTSAVASGSAADDSHYVSVENQLSSLTAERDALTAQIRTALGNAAFGTGSPASEQRLEDLTEQGREILNRAQDLAGGGEQDRNSNN
jgi:hypothetical protein